MAAHASATQSMGPGTYEIPLQLYELNRKRLVEELRSNKLEQTVVLLQGGNDIPFYDTDINYNFRQESYFTWTFGVTESGCYGAVDVKTGKAYLFFPRLPETYAVWMGPLHRCDDFKKKYGVDEVYYVDEISTILKKICPSKLLILSSINNDSGLSFEEATFEGITDFSVDKERLYPIIAELRVCKTDYEIGVMRYVASVSSTAHRKIMSGIKNMTHEFQCESEFLHHCYGTGGCRHASYTCICGSGTNSSILHYGHAGAPNDKKIQDGDMCLFDMGANYFGYSADITCSYPASGKFTADQKLVYEAVLRANLAVHKNAKPGVKWTDMHLLANREMLAALQEGGLLKGELDEMVNSGLGSVFQPHGLGHLLGLDTHDVGGYLPGLPERCTTGVPGLEKLRTSRVLLERMIITIEPGCYFIDCLLDKALKHPVWSKFLVPDVLERFRNFGGVRIEDNVLITASGVENLTRVPRTVQEIEDFIAGKDNTQY